MGHLQPPKAPSDQLRLESFQTLSRLQLIFEFRVWLEHTRDNVPRRFDSPLVRLWDCFSFGAPLCTLLDLLGSPTPHQLRVYPEDFDFDLDMEQRQVYIASFIQRTNALEIQGRLSYGEVVKVEDFVGGTLSGYARVLKTVKRVLTALQSTDPDLFIVPHGSPARRRSLLQQLLGGERVHVSRLADVAEAASQLYANESGVVDPALEGFIVNCSRLIPYHNLVLDALSDVAKGDAVERWDEIFSFTSKILRTNIFTAYRALCANFLPLRGYLKAAIHKGSAESTRTILQHLSFLLGRTSEYHLVLQAILDVTTPDTPALYDTLCLMTFEMYQLSETINEVGTELRTMWATRRLPSRLGALKSLSMEALGSVLLDDRLMIDPISGVHYSVFLFHTMLFCCTERDDIGYGTSRYPVKPWELGAALSQTCPLSLVYAVPTKNFSSLHCIDEGYFELNWVDPSNTERTTVFYPVMPAQYTQWISQLEQLVPRVYRSSSVPGPEDDFGSINTGFSLVLTGDERMYERRKSTARPWSVKARKGARSESSSLFVETRQEDERSVLSSNLLPNLFPDTSRPSSAESKGARRTTRSQSRGSGTRRGHTRHGPKSPLSSGFTRDDLMREGRTPVKSLLYIPGPRKDVGVVEDDNGRPLVADLTGQVVKDGDYPVAHGGHSDVWKAVWRKDGVEVGTAVKVLRNTTNDPEKKAKLISGLHHELRVWKQLNHPHVLPLYGTVSDFGPCISMACPWMENGSLSKYLEKCGDILSVEARLRIISEVAEGLAYLHISSVIHGDLTGSNVLLTNDLKVQLCDFGLSTVVMQSDSQTPDSFTSGLGGAVRWADSALFSGLHTASEEEEWHPPPLTYKSDVYSLGSVILEILSGRQPYHYIATDAQVVIELHKGNKPRRPTQSFVDDGQWELIQWCWTQPPEDRPDVHDVVDRVGDMIRERGARDSEGPVRKSR